MVISADGKGKTAGNVLLWTVRVRALKRTACKHRLLRTVERNGTEFLPVANELIFNHYFMNSKFTLIVVRDTALDQSRLAKTYISQ